MVELMLELNQALERSEFFLDCLKESIDDEGKQYALKELQYWCWKEDVLRERLGWKQGI